MHALRVAIAALVLLGAGCGDPASTLDSGGSSDGGARCKAGDTVACVCLGGGAGTRTCRANGQGYDTCTGCGPEESDGPLPTIQDGGSTTCGDCDGCCDGTACVPYASQLNTLCGKRGTSCSPCGTKVCDKTSGACLAAGGGCSPSNCGDGCCKMVDGVPSCQEMEPTACGTGGGSCTACTNGVLCDGTCTTSIDPDYNFKVYVKSLSFDSRDDGDACWDNYVGFGCADAEVKVCFAIQVGNAMLEGCTDRIDGVAGGEPGQTIDLSWSESAGLIRLSGQAVLIPGSAFIEGGKVRIRALEDDDVNGDDVIASGYYTPVSTLTSPMTVGAYGHVKSITFELR